MQNMSYTFVITRWVAITVATGFVEGGATLPSCWFVRSDLWLPRDGHRPSAPPRRTGDASNITFNADDMKDKDKTP